MLISSLFTSFVNVFFVVVVDVVVVAFFYIYINTMRQIKDNVLSYFSTEH